MRILITNDDGVHAPGIRALAQEIEKEHDVIIVAPDVERSAQSHAITIFDPLVIREQTLEGLIKTRAYSVSGTPADCVRAGFEAIAPGGEPFDLVLSGLNAGLNAGMDVLYSGTVSAAIEANLYGLPSIAASCQTDEHWRADFTPAAKMVAAFVRDHGEKLLQYKILLNLNFPYKMKTDRLAVARIGDPVFDYFLVEENGNGESVLTAKGRRRIAFEEGTDRWYLNEGIPTITPLRYDFTDLAWMDRLESWWTKPS